ncbi:ParB/RepB/Spo0J family partition protein [Chondromyces apiculatus]|uniref:Chromosome (Plasmid) partitioning protein ParB / Stage 0 sporulation protein J n=1 Tax=Chondromyces apiculatus DSM 436 TaxID=1192034 RepID=A0A017SVR8_9BACT|nr:ParB/RepB/Spo0J family partition protein [Chondromyces apiculatus]EYF00877.1 Chromosome (plasmid) partitioning protein ParB / Stage 0 sporulation protein J [Chondromyces apiculatus DSM 436]
MSTDVKGQRRALGRGLDALLPGPVASGSVERSVFLCAIEKIVPQKGQPRQYFDETELEELTASIREHGLIEPLVVRRGSPGSDRFEIIAGERRWRAAQRAGLHDVVVVVKDVSPKEAFELALIENVQRSDLNPIEVAEALDRLLREHGYTQEVLAERVGKDRSTITNVLRLLKLPTRIRSKVISRELSEGHARALLGAPDEKSMDDIAERAIRGKLPVRKVESLVRAAKERATAPAEEKPAGTDKPPAGKSASVRDLETRLTRRLGTKVEVRDQGGRGELGIAYSSLDELDRILALLDG